MSTTPAGYSGTPLAKKLGYRRGHRVLTLGAPAHYRELLQSLPEGVSFVDQLDAAVDLVHLFATVRATLEAQLRDCRAALAPAATVWVSWPKKSARLKSEITEDTVRELALPLGFVDVKVCAVDATWSGLKLVVRRELR